MNTSKLAEIQYHGVAGVTADCRTAIERLLLCQPSLDTALLLTASEDASVSHAFLLTSPTGIQTAIKSGFSSGYGGEGPRGLARALKLFELHKVELDEIDVSTSILDRLNRSCLTRSDLKLIEGTKRIRPKRYSDYMAPYHDFTQKPQNPWRNRPVDIPLPLIDDRLIDEAIGFWDDPDATLIKAFRKLEVIVRARLHEDTQEKEDLVGNKLFARAFNSDDAPLSWPDISVPERQGRTSLFIGAFAAFRNRRAHREADTCAHAMTNEFLLVNQLFLLEQEAEGPRPSNTDASNF